MKRLPFARLLGAFLRTYARVILLCLLLPTGFVALHLLGRGEIQELRYSLLLTAALLAVAFVLAFVRFLPKQMRLWDALRDLPPDAEDVPEAQGMLEESYRELAVRYQRAQNEAETRAAAAERERVDYYTLWMHQIKTPIAVISLMAQTDSPIDRELLKQELFKVEQYADAALSYQRLQSLHRDLDLVEAPLYPLCCSVVKKLRPLFLYRQISPRLEPFEGTALTDVKWLGMAMTQVLTNALKYTPAQGYVAIRLDSPGVLVIEDNGIGIRAEDVPRVFERGFTGRIGRDTEKSTGIGLYLCREACRKLGHKVRLESEQGKGTRVTFDLRRDAYDAF
ncbi:MAG: sensor histidine kinase [Eubacteriales bacterium]|nr:sensor histidine kinase [Eubacteriales bacterium]